MKIWEANGEMVEIAPGQCFSASDFPTDSVTEKFLWDVTYLHVLLRDKLTKMLSSL
jgi:hypothetical protein